MGRSSSWHGVDYHCLREGRPALRAQGFKSRAPPGVQISAAVSNTAGKQFLRVVGLLEGHRLAELIAAVERAIELDVDDNAAIALLLDQRTSTTSAPLTADVLPREARIESPRARLDGYVVADLKEVA